MTIGTTADVSSSLVLIAVTTIVAARLEQAPLVGCLLERPWQELSIASAARLAQDRIFEFAIAMEAMVTQGNFTAGKIAFELVLLEACQPSQGSYPYQLILHASIAFTTTAQTKPS